MSEVETRSLENDETFLPLSTLEAWFSKTAAQVPASLNRKTDANRQTYGLMGICKPNQKA